MHPIGKLQSIVQQAFHDLNLPERPVELYDPIRYTLDLGGKRLRPYLVLASCDMFGGNIEDAVHPAIGIELFHNFTLLHDDLMDQAPLRRGKQTVYKKWNPNIAILAGDTMFALANREMLKTNTEAVRGISDLFNLTAIEVCEGQQLDMNFELRKDVTLPEYIEMIRLKTAVLLAASLKIGAMIAGASEEKSKAVYDFGISIGIGFQIMDDLLDVYGTEEKFGKKPGGDILAAKKTYLYLKALELSDRNDAERLGSVYESTAMPADEKIETVRALFHRVRIEDITRHEIDTYWKNSIRIMQSLNLPENQTRPLMEYCSKLMERDY